MIHVRCHENLAPSHHVVACCPCVVLRSCACLQACSQGTDGDFVLCAVWREECKHPALPSGLEPDPLFMHSHNDYERPVPVFEALAYGALSVESDVWLNPKVCNAR